MLKLKEVRLEKGLTQKQLADAVGMNIRTLQHYEQGSKIFDHARLDTLLKICLALNCKLTDVIENDEYIDLIQKYES